MPGDIPNGEHLESKDAGNAAAQDSSQAPPQIPSSTSEPNPPPTPNGRTEAHKPDRDWLDYVKFVVEVVGLGFLITYTVYAGLSWREMRKATGAATKSADTAANEFEISQRPWVKVSHNIVKPLAFNVDRNGGPMAMMTIRDIIENVGQTVAVDVVSWEDVIPMGPNLSISAAESRQSQWCDANRHPQMSSLLSGKVLFPKDPLIQDSIVGPSMKAVLEAAAESPQGLAGKVSFVLVGCVCYRAAFEGKTAPAHQTRFLYYLGAPQNGAGWYPWVTPVGIANGLNLIDVGKFSAD